jgi:hypothetical protein
VVATPASGTITDTFFEGGRICNTQSGTDFLIGNSLAVTIQNSRIGKACDDYIDGSTTMLLFGIGLGSNVTLIATGNDLSYTGGESWTPFSGLPVGDSIIGNNVGIDNTHGPTYSSGTTVAQTLMANKFHLTGTTTVQTITGGWNGQQVCVVSDDGAISFGTSGNIAAAVATSGAKGSVCGFYDGSTSKWYLH